MDDNEKYNPGFGTKDPDLDDWSLMPFGVHKDKLMKDVPPGYWLYLWERRPIGHSGVRDYVEKNLTKIKLAQEAIDLKKQLSQMRVNARFIGKDSVGYRHGERYELKIIGMGNAIARLDNSGACEYGSIKKFLENWDEIKHL